jgi:hypothetical protein
VTQRLIKAVLVAITIGAACGVSATPGRAGMVVVNSTISEAERVMLEQNPALSELAANSPEGLRQALDLIATAFANPSISRGGIEDLDATDVKLLGQNPALLQVWRSSPEASADLLLLIRTAAGGGKPSR